jgi:hypothetical protein
MRVLLTIGMRVVVAVVRGPPDGPALDGGRPEQGEGELRRPRRLEGAVREITVIEAVMANMRSRNVASAMSSATGL